MATLDPVEEIAACFVLIGTRVIGEGHVSTYYLRLALFLYQIRNELSLICSSFLFISTLYVMVSNLNQIMSLFNRSQSCELFRPKVHTVHSSFLCSDFSRTMTLNLKPTNPITLATVVTP